MFGTMEKYTPLYGIDLLRAKYNSLKGSCLPSKWKECQKSETSNCDAT